MESIPLKNKQIKKNLTFFSDFISDPINQKALNTASKIFHPLKNTHDDTPLSKEYLQEAMESVENYGFPAISLGMCVNRDLISDQILDEQLAILNNINELGIYLGVRNNALAMYYPPNGFIGWHHNANAYGYNVLFSYSVNDTGVFYYYDHDDDKIIEMQDESGWNVKVGYYPSLKENEIKKPFWHAAGTSTSRITVAFMINSKILWEDMIEEISSED